MGIGLRILHYLISLRTLVVLGLVLLLLDVVKPSWLVRSGAALDRISLHAAVDFVALPTPRTSVTVIHVPDVEYDAWMADIAGADSFARLFKLTERPADQEPTAEAPAPQKMILGLVAEVPVDIIQGRAERLVSSLANDERVRSKSLRADIERVVAERQTMLERMHRQVVVGIAERPSEARHPVTYSPFKLPVDWLSPELYQWLWRWPTQEGQSASTAIEHLKLPAAGKISQSLLIPTHDHSLSESFILRFWRQRGALEGDTKLERLPPWQQGAVLEVDNLHLPISYNGSIVPLYGEITGILVPTMQLTLAAAERASQLSGWVLAGRNDSAQLRVSAQTLAALNDGAYLTVPDLFPLAKLLLWLLLALWVMVLMPRISTGFWLLSALMIIGVSVCVQWLAAGTLGYWLPLGEFLTVVALVYLAMAIYRFKRARLLLVGSERYYWALRAAALHYQAGQFEQARKAIVQVPLNQRSLRWYYRIAKGLMAQHYPAKALPLWRLLHKKARNFKDVKQQINICEQKLRDVVKPVVSDKTQVVCVTNPIEKLGRYEVRSVLGHGGSGVVYKGYDPVISRDVALKTLNLNVFSPESQTKVKNRFLTEVQTVGKLSHPNIVAVFDAGQQDHWAYIAMDYAKGQPLTEYVKEGTLLPVAEVYLIGLRVAQALNFAHQQNIVHCDIKPGNILYDRDSFDVKVTDFGIAQWLDAAHTETGEIMGSPLYMAPEQLQGRPVTEQTDIFSLGATLYQLLTGQAPFNGRSIAEIQQAVLHSRPMSVRSARKTLPTSAARIINRALQKKTGDRFASASDMAYTLNKALIRDFKDEAKQWQLL